MAWGLLLVLLATLLPRPPCLLTEVRVAERRGIPGSPWDDPGGGARFLDELSLLILNLPGSASGLLYTREKGLVLARSALRSSE